MPIPSFEHNKTISYQLTAIYELLVKLLCIISRLNPSTPDLYPHIRHLRVEVCHILLRYLENKSRIELQIILYVKCYRYEFISYVSVLQTKTIQTKTLSVIFSLIAIPIVSSRFIDLQSFHDCIWIILVMHFRIHYSSSFIIRE